MILTYYTPSIIYMYNKKEKMKKYITTHAFIILFGLLMGLHVSSTGQSFTFSENDARVTPSRVIPTGSLYTENLWSKKNRYWKYSIFFLQNPLFAEVLPGVTWSSDTNSTFSIIVQGGLESNKIPRVQGRGLVGCIYKKQKLLIKSFVEIGEGRDNYWWHWSLEHNGKGTYGLMSRRFYGSGVRGGYWISKNVLTQGALLWNTETGKLTPTVFLSYRW